ncbi:YceI family protein [Sporosarcina pasteurii]|uniref:Uncharacterized conserved protein n=1 Tax=Sporosarcina pasteurii TaxID=1474 RepID=A0A380CH36_SPOPA|nr:YceI family protein [Sporosarcina pasteurii]MDS9472135.1 YceI family protein [Sporosarcina pasteurii]QBQ06850.1 polyisoprenoid-binding protein [Sporosarcina pasteurii]SUJ20414.1 Uncharacterized conserved protein [Sporosarcina pasteurii]
MGNEVQTTNHWVVDAAHTSVGFTVKHMMFSKVRGSFTGVEGKLVGNPEDLTNAKIDFNIDVSTIHTNNEDRDNHLRSADFFDVDNHSHLSFVSTNIVKTSDTLYDVTGDVTMKGVTKSVTFTAEYEGTGKNPWGVDVAAFEVTGKISRSEFDLTWNQVLEAGGVLVGDDIALTMDVQLNPAQ